MEDSVRFRRKTSHHLQQKRQSSVWVTLMCAAAAAAAYLSPSLPEVLLDKVHGLRRDDIAVGLEVFTYVKHMHV